jgi:diacylglycerol O-acyltransferase-1
MISGLFKRKAKRQMEKAHKVINDKLEPLSPSRDNKKVFHHSNAVHVNAHHSPLSKEAPVQDYRGFVNLAMLLLFVSNLRLVFENYMKYGVLLTDPLNGIPNQDYVYFAQCMVVAVLNILTSYALEKIAVASLGWYKIIRIAIVLNIVLSLFAPTAITWYLIYHPMIGIIAIMQSVILFMKLISYHLVNYDLQRLCEEKEEPPYPELPYPQNVTFGNLIYFWCAPTLCYQPVYPRTEHIRKFFLVKRTIELISALLMVFFLLHQYAVPTVKNSMKPIQELNFLGIFERILKLSISSLYIWLLGFYIFFHLFLNILAECLQFADRQFYLPWWNANTLGEYWRLWNLPVHLWFKRHMYVPMRNLGVSSVTSMIVIFFCSAVLHEFAFGVPTHVIKLYAFMGMIGQIPLIWMTNLLASLKPNSSIGNYIFWVTFCILGQPACVLLYYRAWNNKE